MSQFFRGSRECISIARHRSHVTCHSFSDSGVDQRGIDFAPAADFLEGLRAAGATEAFLKALRTASGPVSTSAQKPLNQVQVFALLAGQIPSQRVAMLVKERGIDFDATNDYLNQVRTAGGDDELIGALRHA